MKLLNDISQIDRRQWKDLVNRSPVASAFQTPEMYDFYASIGLFGLKVIGVEEGESLKGVVVCTILTEGKGMKKKFSSRAVVNGGPLLDDGITKEALTLLLQSAVAELRRESVFVETRNYNDYSRWKEVFEACGFSYQPHYNFHIDTSSSEEVERNISKSRRKKIRRAMERGVIVEQDNDAIHSFYSLLSDLYHEKIHKPLFPEAFFEALVQQPFTRLFVVKSPNGTVVGGQLCVLLNESVVYSWFCCGLDTEYHELFPSIMANYAAIRYAVDQGFSRLDMMGAGSPGDGGYGVRDFKAQFGGTLVEHGRYLHINRRLIYVLGKMYVKLKSKS